MLLEAFPGLVVIDEAYQEFSRQDAKPWLREYHNLVILRTFSKALALAGMRIGYLMAAPEICAEVQKARLPYSVNLFSEIAVTMAVRQPELVKLAVKKFGAPAIAVAIDARDNRVTVDGWETNSSQTPNRKSEIVNRKS